MYIESVALIKSIFQYQWHCMEKKNEQILSTNKAPGSNDHQKKINWALPPISTSLLFQIILLFLFFTGWPPPINQISLFHHFFFATVIIE